MKKFDFVKAGFWGLFVLLVLLCLRAGISGVIIYKISIAFVSWIASFAFAKLAMTVRFVILIGVR